MMEIYNELMNLPVLISRRGYSFLLIFFLKNNYYKEIVL
jgi:hypothetical protein